MKHYIFTESQKQMESILLDVIEIGYMYSQKGLGIQEAKQTFLKKYREKMSVIPKSMTTENKTNETNKTKSI